METNRELTWLHPQGVQSTKGFIVETAGRFGLNYREGGRLLELDCEWGFNDDDNLVLYVSVSKQLRWAAPHENEVIGPLKHSQIIENLSKAIRFMEAIPILD